MPSCGTATVEVELLAYATAEDRMRLGFIGLGSMGAAMARNLAGAGHDLTVYDLDPGRVDDLVRSGARPGACGEDVAGAAGVLFTSLPGPRQAAAAMPSLIDALRPGATWVDLTRRGGRSGSSAIASPQEAIVDSHPHRVLVFRIPQNFSITERDAACIGGIGRAQQQLALRPGDGRGLP